MEESVEKFIREKASQTYGRSIENTTVFIETYLINLLLIHDEIKSPIEKMFFLEWHYQKIFIPDDGYILIPQYRDKDITGKYFVDFMATELLDNTKIAIEIDGHDFHEKTKEQVRLDKKRERFITKNVFKFLRFSGSEIYKSPIEALTEVRDLIDKIEEEGV